MKVFTIDCFANEENANARDILGCFLSGLSSAGAELTTMRLCEHAIAECRHCTDNIDFKSDKHCLQQDEMNALYPDIQQADLWVFAFPFKASLPNHKLCNILDRFEPLCGIEIEETRKQKRGKVVILSTGSFWDVEIFDPVIEQFEDFASLYNRDFAGAILRPDFNSINLAERYNGHLEKICTAAKNAGEQLATSGEIPEVTLKAISANISERKHLEYAHN